MRHEQHYLHGARDLELQQAWCSSSGRFTGWVRDS